MEEIWKDIEDYEGYYQISNLGRIKSLERTIEHAKCGIKKVKERIMKNKKLFGYERIGLCMDGVIKYYFIHRLVASAFIPNADNKPEVNHINGIKNDNRVENLEWVTISENRLHAYRIGLQFPSKPMTGRSGKNSPTSKQILQYDLNGRLLAEFVSAKDAEVNTGINHVYRCANGLRKSAGGYVWKYK